MLAILKTLFNQKLSLFSAGCIVLSAVLFFMSRYVDGFAQWYASKIYPVLQVAFGSVFSVWNYSFFEAGMILLIMVTLSLVLAGISLLILRNFRMSRHLQRKPHMSVHLLRSSRLLICTGSVLLFIYTMTGAVNYHRESIGEVLNLPVNESSKDTLIKLSMILVNDLSSLTEDPGWDYRLLTVQDPAYIETQAVNAMKMLGTKEPSLSGYYANPKPVYFSSVMSGLGIEGIFSPFTMEANYNRNTTSFLIPYTICHELAHMKGYMKEDDAGYIAYLACKNSPSQAFQYSGMFQALTFTLNALKSEATEEEFNAVYQQLPDQVRNQLGYVKEQKQMQATSFSSVAKSVNDLYLKVNAQSGTKSYGGMVDLLIADYADRIEEQDLI